MRILFLTPLLPYPANSGGLIKTLSVLDYLAPRHSLDVLCFRPEDLMEEQKAFIDAFPGRLDCFPLRRGRSVANLAASYALGVPLSVYRNRSPEFARIVSDRLAGTRFDAVFVDHWLMAQYLPPAFDGPAALHQHNAEHLVWSRQAGSEANPVLRLLLRLEARRVARYEQAVLRRFRWLFAVSEDDRRALIELGAPPDRIAVLPNLPDQALLEAAPLSFGEAPPNLLYIGTLSWQPNVDGLRSFLRDGLPLLRTRLPAARLIVAGRAPPPWLRRLARREPALELISPAEQPEPLYRRARVFLETVRGGGGVKVKVLNALARGLPVVTTPDGAQGTGAVDGEHLLVGDDASALVEGAVRVVEDESLWRRLSENGRALVRERYRPEVAYRPLDEVFCSGG